MPPMKTFKNGEVWLKGFAANNIRMVPAAVAMNSVDFRDRPACIYDGWCHVGCPIGALANPQVTYLGEARAAGAEVRALSTVTRILTDASGKKATGVEYYDAQHGKHFQPASVVMLHHGRRRTRACCSTRRPTSIRTASPTRAGWSANTS